MSLSIRIWVLVSLLLTAGAVSTAAQEPTYDFVSKLVPVHGRSLTMVGLKDVPARFYVGWNGSVGTSPGQGVKGMLMQFASGYPFTRFGRKGSVSLSLTGGFYPAPVTRWRQAGISYEETVFAHRIPGMEDHLAAMVALEIRNETVSTASVPLFVFLGDSEARERDSRIPQKPPVKYPLSFDKGRLLDADGNMILYAPSDPKPDYLPNFAGAAFAQPSGGPILANLQRKTQSGATFTLEFEPSGRETKFLHDSLGSLSREKVLTFGFDMLVRADRDTPQPLLVRVKLNGRDLGYIAKTGLAKDPPPVDDFLAADDTSMWVTWDSIKQYIATGTNKLEFTALSTDKLSPVTDWRPLIALAGAGSAKPSEVLWPGDSPGEEWVRGLAYPNDTLVYQLSIDPRSTVEMFFYMPDVPIPAKEADEIASLKFQDALEDLKREWDAALDPSAKINVPLRQANDTYRAALAGILLGTEAQRDYHEPWLLPSLDEVGYSDLVENRLDYLFAKQGRTDIISSLLVADLDANGNGKIDEDDMKGFLGHSPFSMSDNGIILWQAAEHYRLTGDRAWFEKHLQGVLDACSWIERQRNRDRLSDGSPKIVGLLPPERIPYTYELEYRCGSGDAWNYLGLKAAASVLKELGHPEGDKLLAQAKDYRQDIIANTKAVMPEEMTPDAYDFSHYSRSAVPSIRESVIDGSPVPFVPMGPNLRVPSGYGGYSIWGPINFIVSGVDEPNGRRADRIVKFAEKYLLMCEKVGGIGMPLGIPCLADNVKDPMYFTADVTHTGEYALSYLYRDEIEKFVAAFLTLQVCSLNQTLPETRGQYLVMLRDMLVHEDGDTLRVCQAVPREWLETGRKIDVENLRTYFGGVSFRMDSELVVDRITCDFTLAARKAPKAVIIRFRHPQSRPIRSVELNGLPYTNFKGEEVTLTDVSKPVKLVVHY